MSQLDKIINIFKCPVCGSSIQSEEAKNISCLNKHSFDISKEGYVNLLLSPVKTQYDKKLFLSRSIICRSGFFKPITDCITDIIKEGINKTDNNSIKILDAGCGEGSHLAQIIENLNGKSDAEYFGVGVDISKEGIKMAAKNHSQNNVWCVADITKTPFINKGFNAVLNILTPSNYTEFDRIIADNGLLIKAIPGSNYLKELRNIFYNNTDKETYSNEKVLKYFSKHFDLCSTRNIEYQVELTRDNLEQLINMTPLSWGADDEEIQKTLTIGINKITVDMTVIVGKKNNIK
ncbi:23S rRNA (guanine(745)-N(1))-methyltransferase [Oxobacter pfennigii]|uniref:23S rRNA (Guanine(745)-N(1))-methyltransferase n=1 Tax=Oxobacter pfennigii TaxID=36849 RepID=A0A0P8X3D0_9CLOT|nr:methyltransferase domain-containing protein [Oxobacter pfennigii]KPU45279.1 23S rRNA (guanine(745)-N(1))-methyltransferase [Oxobacter pfennigii]